MKERFSEFNCRRVFWKKAWVPSQSWLSREITAEVFQELRMKTDVYWSIQRYRTELLAATCDEDQKDLEYVAPLIFDIDAHSSNIQLHQVTRQLCRLIVWIRTRMKVTDEEIFVWFSGRGYHVVIPAEIMLEHPVTSIDQIEQGFKKFALLAEREADLKQPIRICDDGKYPTVYRSALDYSVYKSSQLLRVPGSIHSRPRLEIANRKFRLDLSHINCLAAKPNQDEFRRSFSLLAEQPFLSWEEWI